MSYADKVLADSPAYWYRFQEPDGVTTAANSGSAPGSGTYDGPSGVLHRQSSPLADGSGYSIETGNSGGNAFVTINHGSIGGPGGWSVEFWWRYLPSSPANNLIWETTGIDCKQSLNRDGTLRLWNTNEITAVDPLPSGSFSPPSGLSSGAWYHIVITATGDGDSEAILYINGEQLESWNTAWSAQLWNSSILGRQSGNVVRAGYAEFAVYNHVLSPYRIATHYEAALEIPPEYEPESDTGPGVVDFNAYQAAVAQDSPLHHYPLDETVGSTAYLSNGVAGGYYYNNPIKGEPGLYRGSASSVRTTVDSRISLGTGFDPGPPGSSDFDLGDTSTTIEMWWKKAGPLGLVFAGWLCQLYLAPGNALLKWRKKGASGIYADNYEFPITLPPGLNPYDGNSHHIVVVQQDGILRLYIDGNQVGAWTGTLGPFRSGLSLGKNDWDYDPGAWDGVATYDYALPSHRILAHYLAGSGLRAGTIETVPPATVHVVQLFPVAALQEESYIPSPGFSWLASEYDIIPSVHVIANEVKRVAPAVESQTALPLDWSGLFDLPVEIGAGLVTETDECLLSEVLVNFVVQVVEEDSAPPYGALSCSLSYGMSGDLYVAGETFVVVPEFNLTIMNPALVRTPSTLTFMVAGGIPEAEIRFYIVHSGGVESAVWFTETNTSGDLDPSSINVETGRPYSGPGTYKLKAVQNMVNGDPVTAEAVFTVEKAPLASPINQPPDALPVEIPGAVRHGVRHWVFQDLRPTPNGGLGSWVLPISPHEMSAPHRENTFSSRHTTARAESGGQFHIFQAGQTMLEWKFSGYAPDEEFCDQLWAYRNLNRRFYVIDHRNRAWKVVFTNLEIKPRLRQNFNGVMDDWGSDYTVTAALMDQKWVQPEPLP